MDGSRLARRLGLSAAITVGFAALLVAVVPVGDLLGQFTEVSLHWAWLPLFFLAVLGNVYLRGATLALIVNATPAVGQARWLAISCAHNLGTSLSGMVFGDAFLFWLMYRFGIHWKKSIFTTLLARVFELPPLLLVFFVGVLGVPGLLPGQQLVALLLGVAFVTGVALLFVLDPLLGRVPHRVWLGHEDKVAGFRGAYRELTARGMWALLALSFAKIALSLLYFVFALQFFGQGLSLLQVCLLFGVFNFATALPVQGLAGLGTFEAYFGAGLVLMGWAGAAALALAFQVHMLFLASFVLLALVAVVPVLFTGATQTR